MKAEIFHETKDGCIIRILVHPNAKNAGITAVLPEALEVRLKSPPLKNRANIELIDLLSKVFDVQKTDLQIIAGWQSREKFLFIRRQKHYVEHKLSTSLK